MAGIGFELNKLLKRNSFFSDIFAFFYSANISAGPWIISSITVFLIQSLIPQEKIPFLISGIIYTFIFSTILFGSVSTSVTRYLSDLIYRKDFQNIYQLYISSVNYALLSSAIFLVIFFTANRIFDVVKIGLFSYSLTVLTVIWVQTVFISSIRKFFPVVSAFLIGGLISLISTLILFKIFGEYYAYFGFNLGLMTIMVLLQTVIKSHLYTKNEHRLGINLFIEAIRKYKIQTIAGIFTYLAAWVDDFIAWTHFKYSISKGFIFAPQYDIPMFISYLFIIPTLSLFVLILETDFYNHYRLFYRSIEENRTFKFIRLAKSGLDDVLHSTTKSVLSIQFSFMLVGLILSDEIANLLLLDEYGLKTLRFGIVGAALNGIFLYISLVAHYFDLPDIPMKGAIMAFSINLITSILTIRIYPGLGFLIGFCFSTIYSFFSFNKIYSDLIRFEFTRSKLLIAQREVIVHENK
ncbi:MAG: exopolysaccharide Pel transporter PelG [Fervidobacterium sp.]